VKFSGRRLLRPLVGFVLLFASGCAATSRAPGTDVFLLAGQSNMSGRGDLRELTDVEREPDPAIRLYGNDGRWREALDPLDDPNGQVDPVSADPQAAVGPGLTFARELRKIRKRPVVLVPCAKGGASIVRWRPDAARESLYGSCLARARAVGERVRGILWYQGETDAESETRSAEWAKAFSDLVRSLRADLGSERLPVVFVQLADAPRWPERARSFPGWSTIQEAQGNLREQCVSMVSAKGLATRDDELHLTTEAQRGLGVRLAAAMHMLLRNGCK
jgi:hypothetical protein